MRRRARRQEFGAFADFEPVTPTGVSTRRRTGLRKSSPWSAPPAKGYRRAIGVGRDLHPPGRSTSQPRVSRGPSLSNGNGERRTWRSADHRQFRGKGPGKSERHASARNGGRLCLSGFRLAVHGQQRLSGCRQVHPLGATLAGLQLRCDRFDDFRLRRRRQGGSHLRRRVLRAGLRRQDGRCTLLASARDGDMVEQNIVADPDHSDRSKIISQCRRRRASIPTATRHARPDPAVPSNSAFNGMMDKILYGPAL